MIKHAWEREGGFPKIIWPIDRWPDMNSNLERLCPTNSPMKLLNGDVLPMSFSTRLWTVMFGFSFGLYSF